MDKDLDWRALPQYMMSSRPSWVRLDLAGARTDEVRRTAPKINRKEGAVVWLYETKAGDGRGAVVAAFLCPAVHPVSGPLLELREKEMVRRSCMTIEDLWLYMGDRSLLLFWEIGAIERLPRPLPVSAFGLKCPPQSWCRCRAPAAGVL